MGELPNPQVTVPGPARNDRILFWASFLTLIAAGIGFSVRGAILKDWGNQFGFTQSELGTITGGGLFGFGLAIIFFSFCADLFGYGKLMLVAFLLHAASAVLTFAATPVYDALGKPAAFQCLWWGMLLFALGNGTCEAVINPLTATLFPRSKTHWLNILHAGWPLGLILGALIVLGFGLVGTPEQPIRWEFKLGVFLVPVVLYGLLMFNRPFPRSEASASGVSMQSQILTLLAPLLLFLFVLHALVGYVELGTDSWITNITTQVLSNETLALLAFIWTNALMFILRFFAGPIVHKINPIGLLVISAVFGTLGLLLLGQPAVNTMALWLGAVTIYGIGKTFYWPTLLGVISERFPRGGALALGISGGIGMISAGLLGGPGIGYKQDYFAVEKIRELSEPTYQRYVARTEQGDPEKTGYPVASKIAPDKVPMIAGLDNSKLKVFDDYSGYLGKVEQAKKDNKPAPTGPATTLESDLATLDREKAAGKPVEPKLEQNLTALKTWWDDKGKPNYESDKPKIEESRLYGAKQALLYTAAVPAMLVVGFLLLLAYFAATGGYKQVHIEQEPPMGEY